ncbi:hypothetical protein SAMD00023353_4400260 [Rosellinia necatrix]|uniref:Uncharacterized protein n=1 Tax=Rosellinia necatrix TaxID=77044 RepID=A0A1S8A9E8_ROSNE|nr:hypothetical protein SAMD00023353_4400260 [Rosellinia necatrix]
MASRVVLSLTPSSFAGQFPASYPWRLGRGEGGAVTDAGPTRWSNNLKDARREGFPYMSGGVGEHTIINVRDERPAGDSKGIDGVEGEEEEEG